MAISTDAIPEQKRFKESLNVPYTILSDKGGKVSKEYVGLVPILGLAHRATFVVGENGTIKDVVTGSDAIDPAGSIAACPLHQKGKP